MRSAPDEDALLEPAAFLPRDAAERERAVGVNRSYVPPAEEGDPRALAVGLETSLRRRTAELDRARAELATAAERLAALSRRGRTRRAAGA